MAKKLKDLVVMDEQYFRDTFEENLGRHTERSITLFNNFGSAWSEDLIYILTLAVKKKKVVDILCELEIHYEKYLRYFPEEVPTLRKGKPMCYTEGVMLKIYEKTLNTSVIHFFAA